MLISWLDGCSARHSKLSAWLRIPECLRSVVDKTESKPYGSFYIAGNEYEIHRKKCLRTRCKRIVNESHPL